jgi:hypothetical protein
MQHAYESTEPTSGVHRVVHAHDDWIRERGSPQLHRATNAIHVPTHAIDHLVLHEWLAETMPGWLPTSMHGVKFAPVPGAQLAGVGSHGRQWIPVHASSGGDWVVRADEAPSEASSVWQRARDDHRSPRLACLTSDAFPGLVHWAAVADVMPPRWRARALGEALPSALLPAKVTAGQVRQLTAELAAARPATDSRTLHQLGIRHATLNDPCFSGTWHVNHIGQALFPYRNAEHVVGLQSEIVAGESSGEWTDETMGAREGVWHSRPRARDQQLVISARAVDALSYHQLRPGPDRRYLAVGCMPSREQFALVARAVAQMPPGSSIIVATSRSLPAEYLVSAVRGAAKSARLPLFQDSPPAEADRWTAPTWTDVLRARDGVTL